MSLYVEACKYIPGGVNSPVRAFRGVGGEPIFFKKAAGSHAWAADGRRFIDYVGSWGPMILGHAHPDVIKAVQTVAADGLSFGAPTELETQLARRVTQLMPSVELVRFVSSGTEATMSAIRLARHHREVRGLLPRTLRFAVDQGRLGSADSGRPHLARRPEIARQSHRHPQLQRRRSSTGGLPADRRANRLRHRRTRRRQYELRAARTGISDCSTPRMRPHRG